MNTNDLFNAVMQLDLEPIKMKLMHAASGEGWSLEKANAVEKEYRRFLCLMKMYPEEDTAPLVDVDTFWHYHILDTMKYAADCEQAFGYFLHHYPYVGMGDEDDAQFRLDSGDRMRDLYEATFGETYPGAVAQAADGATAWCASPHAPNKTGAAAAWCASPHIDKLTRRAIDTAWCASPHIDKLTRRAIGTAWCASPHIDTLTRCGSATAWCASPHAANKTAA
ncbi:MAG: glycine-rich domain-containing protein [Massilia sp.]